MYDRKDSLSYWSWGGHNSAYFFDEELVDEMKDSWKRLQENGALIICKNINCPLFLDDLKKTHDMLVYFKNHIYVFESAEEYLKQAFNFVYEDIQKEARRNIQKRIEKLQEEYAVDWVTRLAVSLRLEGVSYPKIVKRLIEVGYPPISWQAVQGRVERFKSKLLH